MIHLKKIWAGMLLLLIAMPLGCKSQQAQNEGNAPGLEPEIISEGAYCRIDQAGHYFIEDQQSWQDLWERMHEGRIPQPELPPVDFGEAVVVAFFMGEKSSGGYGIELAEARLQGELLKLDLIYREPSSNCAATMAMTQPFLIVKFTQPGIERIEFDTRQEETEC